MKKRSLLAIVLGLCLVSFNYSLAYFSNELLLEDNIISIGEFGVLEDEILEEDSVEDSVEDEILEENNNEVSKNVDSDIIDENLKADEEKEILENETLIENVEMDKDFELKSNEINKTGANNILSE